MNKVTKESINKKIIMVEYRKLTEKITHCTITMENGFQVTGESAVVDPANYDEKIGRVVAYDNAFEKLWVIEGYLLQEKLGLKKKFEERNPRHVIHPDEALNLRVAGEEEERLFKERLIKAVMPKMTPSEMNMKPFLKEYPLTPDQAFGLTKLKEKESMLSEGKNYNHFTKKSEGYDILFKNEGIYFRQEKDLKWSGPIKKWSIFKGMFPDAPDFAFDICNGKIKAEGPDTNLMQNAIVAKFNTIKADEFRFQKQNRGGGFDTYSVRKLSPFVNNGEPVKAEVNFDTRTNKTILPSLGKFYFNLEESMKQDTFIAGCDPYKNQADIKTNPHITNKEPYGKTIFSGTGFKTIEDINVDYHVKITKQFRKDLDGQLQLLKGSRRKSPERSTAIRKLQEAIMWLGMDLKSLSDENPYPNGKNPENTIIEKPADGLKL